MANTARLTGADIVCVGYGAWDGLWGYLHRLLAGLVRLGNRLLYIEGAPPPRRTRLRDLPGAALTTFLGRFRRGGMIAPPPMRGKVFVLTPPIPAPGAAAPRRLGSQLLLELVRTRLRQLGFRHPILWCAFPTGTCLLGKLDERLVVYHCLDDYSALPTLDGEEIRRLEERLLAGADLVLATSAHLFRSLMHRHPNAYYLPAAVEVERFAQGADELKPSDLARLPRPVLGYLGALSPQKVDLQLVASVARAYPKWSICLIGPADHRERAALELILGNRPNVHLLGRKDHTLVPAYYAALDLVLLPYLINERTRALFPLQFAEALAAGKPIVATDLDAIEHYRLSPTLCRIARDREEFVHQVGRALAQPTRARDIRLRREHAQRYSLRRRLDDVQTLLLHRLEAPHEPKEG